MNLNLLPPVANHRSTEVSSPYIIASGTNEVLGSYKSNDDEDHSESKMREDNLIDYRTSKGLAREERNW